jgi:hypothetical protein
MSVAHGGAAREYGRNDWNWGVIVALGFCLAFWVAVIVPLVVLL